MKASHPSNCLKDTPNNNKKHVGSLKYCAGKNCEAYKKITTFWSPKIGLTQGAKEGVLHLPRHKRLSTRNIIYDPVGSQPIGTTRSICTTKSNMAASILAPISYNGGLIGQNFKLKDISTKLHRLINGINTNIFCIASFHEIQYVRHNMAAIM